MLGTAYLVAASRARESANAIARKVLFNDQTNYRPETYLDNVLMKIVRGGGTAPAALGSGAQHLMVVFQQTSNPCWQINTVQQLLKAP